MISLIEVLNYRCLRYVRQELGPFHVLVGPNASGKTTFLDVLGFLHDLVTKGEDRAVELRSSNFYDLVWRQEGHGFEVAVEAPVPQTLCDSLENRGYTTVRYEVAVELDKTANRLEIAAEQALLKAESTSQPTVQRVPRETLIEKDVVASDGSLSPHCLFAKHRGPEGRYNKVLRTSGAVAQMTVSLPKGSLLGGLPDWDLLHPVSRWLRALLSEGIDSIELDPLSLRTPSPRGQGTRIGPHGSNLPWVLAQLKRTSPERLHAWLEHVQTALPEIVGVTTIERPEDRHRYLCLEYQDGLKVPSWTASDGTLRLLALTLPAFLDDFRGVYLIEEPENGVHPLAVETMHQALSWAKMAQVLLATHSPVMLAVSRADDVLCFTQDEEKGTKVTIGSQHPRLRDWKGEIDLGTLFASGVLG
jgi:predicted ATPase